MLRRMTMTLTGFVGAAFCCATIAAAQQTQAFHCSGSGSFTPVNIGTAKGGNFGVLLGDGSGNSQYTAKGTDFSIGGQPVGSGFNSHVGGNSSWTSGILKQGQSVVVWPAKSNTTHVLSSDDGEVHFDYTGAYLLDPFTGMFGAKAVFNIKGGTDRFAGARGIVMVNVVVTGPSPPEPIPFNYDFDGFIILDE